MSEMNSGRHGHSLYLETPRPAYLQRQRSNSLPPNSFLANATEVGMMFSAAEKATARRKKTYSVDYASTPGTPLDSFFESNLFPEPPSHIIQKPSPLRQNTCIRESMDKPLPPEPEVTPTAIVVTPDQPTMSRRSIPTAINLPEKILQQLPVSPISPRRQVGTPSLKTYADSLLQFTHSRLISTIPTVHITAPLPPSQSNDLNLTRSNRQSRPVFESRFSDWSTTNTSAMSSPDPSLSAVPGLMSPDSFFGVQPPTLEFTADRTSGISFASSETFNQIEMVLPPTPPQEDQEISYFTNFDRFLDPQTWSAPRVDDSELGSVIIDLSPVDTGPMTPSDQVMKSIADSTHHRRTSTATTIVRQPSASAPLLGTGMPPCSVSPMTPVHIAKLAVRVPGCWIGAIG